MAPRKRKSEEGADEAKAEAAATRVTRRSARLAKTSPAVPAPGLPKKTKKKGKAADDDIKEAEEKEETAGNNKEEENVEEETLADGNKKTIVIEHCKQCNSFKTRATMVKNGLENAVPGITVLLNPDKPRKGCFEIREEGGEKFITLLDMKRPFKPMKELDMEKVISDIIDKMK